MKKKNNVKKLIVCLTALTLIFSMSLLTGCGSTNEEDSPKVNTFDIAISINYPAKSELDDIKDDTFKIEEGSTVLEVTQVYCSVKNIPLTIETTKGTVYGIEDVYNGDFYKSRQWRYKLNDVLCMDAPNEKYLKKGDTLEWVFVK